MRRESITRQVSNMIILFFLRSQFRKEGKCSTCISRFLSLTKIPISSPSSFSPYPILPSSVPIPVQVRGTQKAELRVLFFPFPVSSFGPIIVPVFKTGSQKKRETRQTPFLPSFLLLCGCRQSYKSVSQDGSVKKREGEERKGIPRYLWKTKFCAANPSPEE